MGRLPSFRTSLTIMVVLLLVALASPAFAQATGIVVADGAIIWRSDVSIPVAVVSEGTVLELTARSERWYEVIIPQNLGGRGDRGLIAIEQVKLLEGSQPPPVRALRGSPPAEQTSVPRAPSRATAVPGPAAALRAFGQIGFLAFRSHQSFEAILGEAHGPTFGGGLQLRFRPGLYVQGSIERFRKTGQRVFVFEDTVFPLGIPNTITIEPITFGAGYRFALRAWILPYVGAGIGTHRLREVSRHEESAERVDERHTGYQVHGGAEFRTHQWLTLAAETQYTTVPDALGTSGVSGAFGERDLGGWQLQVKLLIGR